MPKQKTKILFAIFLTLTLVSEGVFFALYSYTTNEITQTVSEIDQIKSEIIDHESRSYMKKDIELARTYKDAFNLYLIPKDGTVGFLKTLEGLVASSSLKSDVNSVTYEPMTKASPAGLELIHISMSVNGEWKNVQTFLGLLENYPLQISIKKVSMDKFYEYIVKGVKVSQWSGNFDFTVVKLKDK